MSEKLLITGGLGNLGSWVSDYFLRNTDWEIYISSSKLDNPILARNYTLLNFDISKKSEIGFLSDYRFDYIIHLASNNNTQDPAYATLSYQVNTLGTENLISVLDKTSIKKFIYFSTFHVYGNWREFYDESTPCMPLNDYGNSHLLAEKFVQKCGIDYVIYRLSNSYGCPMLASNSMWHLLFNDLSKMAYNSNELIFKSNGNAFRDFIWMGDVCDIIFQSISNPNLKGIYNLSSGESFSLITIAEFVQAAYLDWGNKQIEIKLNLEDKSEHKPYTVSNLRLKEDLKTIQFNIKFKKEAIKIFNLLSASPH